jgi:hypothetical protein
MAKKKQKGITIQKKRKNGIDILVVPPNATPKQICVAYKKQFTAADLAKYLEDDYDQMVPAEQLLAELEAIHNEETAKRNKRKKK